MEYYHLFCTEWLNDTDSFQSGVTVLVIDTWVVMIIRIMGLGLGQSLQSDTKLPCGALRLNYWSNTYILTFGNRMRQLNGLSTYRRYLDMIRCFTSLSTLINIQNNRLVIQTVFHFP